MQFWNSKTQKKNFWPRLWLETAFKWAGLGERPKHSLASRVQRLGKAMASVPPPPDPLVDRYCSRKLAARISALFEIRPFTLNGLILAGSKFKFVGYLVVYLVGCLVHNQPTAITNHTINYQPAKQSSQLGTRARLITLRISSGLGLGSLRISSGLETHLDTSAERLRPRGGGGAFRLLASFFPCMMHDERCPVPPPRSTAWALGSELGARDWLITDRFRPPGPS